MQSERPFALHITWTTYGSWLPGDPRGYVAHTLQSRGEWEDRENTPGTEYAKDHPRTYSQAQNVQKGETVWITPAMAGVVAESLIAASSTRGWRIVRGAILAGHLHLLIFDCPTDGPEVRRVLKGNSQAALTRQNGSPRRWWTAGGSDRYKNDDLAIETAMKYIEDQDKILVSIVENRIQQDHRDKPGGS